MFVPSVCTDKNMGHSFGLNHVLLSGWKRKGLGPITTFSLFLSASTIDLAPDEMFPSEGLSVWASASYCDCSLSQEFLHGRGFDSAWIFLTVFPQIVRALCDSSHANLIYITQPAETMRRWLVIFLD